MVWLVSACLLYCCWWICIWWCWDVPLSPLFTCQVNTFMTRVFPSYSVISLFFLFLPHCSFALLLALAFLCSLSVLSFLYCALTFSFSFLSFSHSCPFKTLHKAYREMSSSRWLSICSGNFLRLVTFAFLSSFSNVASRPRYHNNLCLPAHPCA